MAARMTTAERRARAEIVRLATRRAEAYELYLKGWTQAKIAKHQGIDQATVSVDLAKHRESIPAADRDAMRKDHLERVQRIREAMTELVEMDGAPVTAGKDGTVVVNPETGQLVKDFSLRIQATTQLFKALEREAKLAGLDADAKVVVSGEVAVVDSISAEIAKLAGQLGLNDTIPGDVQTADGLAGQSG